MRWKRGRASGDVIDMRGGGGRRRAGGGVPGGMGGRVGGGLGLVGVLVFVALQLLGGSGSAFDVSPGFDGGAPYAQGEPIPPQQDPDRDLKDFSAYVFDDAQARWAETFQREGRRYERAKLVLYSDAVSTGCGSASSAVGPFYCPADRRVYLDLSFYRDMERQLGAPGDFAWAYVIAHEVGHHVQQQLGTSDEVRRSQQQDPDRANELSVRLELQADCYAGVWGNGVFRAGDLEAGDLEEAVTAAGAVGDDRLQRRAGGGVEPDSFTHGTSEQRVEWFRRGQADGDPGACDTFSA
jgi:predicted metalloprotease